MRIFNKGILLITLLFSLVVLQLNLPNLGGNHTPRSLLAWAAISCGIFLCWLCAWVDKRIFYSRDLLWLFIPPVAALCFGLFGPASPFEYYDVKVIFSLTFGALWVAGLIQLSLTIKEWLNLAICCFASSVALCVITLCGSYYFNVSLVANAFEPLLSAHYGGFQQPNNFVSFLSTANLFMAWCFIKKADSQNEARPQWPTHIAIWTGTFVIAFMIWLSGSRTGYLALFIPTLLMSVWVFKAHQKQYVFFIGWLAAIAIAFLLAINASLFNLEDQFSISRRLQDLANGQASLARKDMWLVSASMWWQAPWFGHGLGSFTKHYTPEFYKLLSLGYDLRYSGNLDHPHNEILLWLTETGLIGTLLVLGPWLLLIWRQCRASVYQHLGWLAALAPIALHCMTEFPLQGSGAHWYLLGLVIAAGISANNLQMQPLNIARNSWLTGFIGLATTSVLITAFLIHSAFLSYKAMVHQTIATNDLIANFERWSNSQEMRHPLLGQFYRDNFVLNTVDLVFQTNDPRLMGHWCEKINAYGQRYQSQYIYDKIEKCSKYL
jgi:O-antigen polymerase